MAALTLIVLTSLCASVLANYATDFPTPFNAQIGALRFPISCKALGFPITLDGYYTGTAPAIAAPGQPVAVTDVTATVTIPGGLQKIGLFVGARSANALVFVNIDAINTTPNTISAFPDGLWVNGTKFSTSDSLTLTVPSKGVLPPVGTFKGNAAGQTATFFLGDLMADVYLYDKNGKQINKKPLSISCPAAPHRVSLGGYNIQGPTNSTPFLPANGYKPAYPALEPLQEIGFFNVPFSCDIGAFKGIVLDLFFGGVLLGSYPSGGQFTFTNISSSLVIPQYLLNAAHNLYGAQTFQSTVSSVIVGLTNASPSTVNIIKSPIVSTFQYPTSGGATLNIPQTGFLTIGPFTAGSAINDYMTLSVANATAALLLKDAKGAVVQKLDTRCHPINGKLELYDILITGKRGIFQTA